jgi:hypothetical protein
MARTEATITMSMREVDRVKTVQAVVDRMLPVGLAAKRLGLGRRQVERLILKYMAGGSAGLVSAKRGRPSNRESAPGVAERALRVIRDHYARLRPYACLREAARVPWPGPRQGDGALAHDGSRPVEASSPARCSDPPASQPPSVSWRARPDRRQRPRLVRGAGFAARPCRLCSPETGSFKQVASAHFRGDLTTVGVCVACATPPVDKSRRSYSLELSCDISIWLAMRHLNLALTSDG